MRIKKFAKFSINENELVVGSKAAELTGEVTLYRLTSHSVVDLSSPGEYYVCDKGDVDPSLLDKKEGNELYLITVTCDVSNIDLDKSEREVAKLGNESIVAVKDDTKCEIISVTPYGNNPVVESVKSVLSNIYSELNPVKKLKKMKEYKHKLIKDIADLEKEIKSKKDQINK